MWPTDRLSAPLRLHPPERGPRYALLVSHLFLVRNAETGRSRVGRHTGRSDAGLPPQGEPSRARSVGVSKGTQEEVSPGALHVPCSLPSGRGGLADRGLGLAAVS